MAEGARQVLAVHMHIQALSRLQAKVLAKRPKAWSVESGRMDGRYRCVSEKLLKV